MSRRKKQVVLILGSLPCALPENVPWEWKNVDFAASWMWHEASVVCLVWDPVGIDLDGLVESIRRVLTKKPGYVERGEKVTLFRCGGLANPRRYLIEQNRTSWTVIQERDSVVLRVGDTEWRVRSAAGMQLVNKLTTRICRGQNILICGEIGSGKTWLARLIHHMLYGEDAPLVRIGPEVTECSVARSELFGHVKGAFTGARRDRVGRLKEADGGTVIFEHVEAYSHATQAALLAFLDERVGQPLGDCEPFHTQCTVISTCRGDPRTAVQRGRLRRDFFARIAQIRIDLPPLRQRIDDIPLLATQFLNEGNDESGKGGKGKTPYRLTKEAVKLLQEHSWPDNLGELRAAVNWIKVMCNGHVVNDRTVLAVLRRLVRSHKTRRKRRTWMDRLRYCLASGENLDEALALAERLLIIRTLAATQGNVSAAARRLGVCRSKLYRWLRKNGIDLSIFRRKRS